MLVSGADAAIAAYGNGTFATINAENYGNGSSADGVHGQTNSPTASGLNGLNTGNGSGVFGESWGDGNGVFGQTSSGIASGVYGENKGMGYGVVGRANNGTAVLADSTNGIALQVNGKLQLSRAGLTIIPANKAFIQITGLSGLDQAASFVIATTQGNSKVWVRSVSVDSTSALTIYLNAKAVAPVPVAWFILN
jgi:hypothetical protein